MSTTIYTDNHGREIAVGKGVLTASSSTGAAFSISLDADQLAALGAALIERSIAEKHGEESERAGAAMGYDLLDELLELRGRPQAEALQAIHDKLHALFMLEHADSAAGGFAVALVNVLEVGVANLPKTDDDEMEVAQ